MFADTKTKVAAAVVLLALVIVPAPLLPPLGMTGIVQSTSGVNWKTAYFVSAIGLHIALYGSLGIAAAFAVGTGKTRRQLSLQLLLLPLVVVGIAVLVRSLKLGHVPMLANAVVPMVACALGVIAALLFRRHGWRVTLAAMLVLGAGLLWAYWPGVSSELSRATAVKLQQLAAETEKLPVGEERFGALLRAAFASSPATTTPTGAIEQNQAAILALGIAIGHERLARLVGLDRKSELVRAAVALRPGTTLRGREDWARHYCLSAALAVVQTPFVSDSGGLIKEELDALAKGSGFSFGDLAADRAGVRFAQAATHSSAAALKLQNRLQNDFSVDDFFPIVADLPENLTVEQFRQDYGGVGSARYRQNLSDIEIRLNHCAALALP